MLPHCDGNRAILARFQEEGLDVVEFYDSDVSDGELDDAIGDLRLAFRSKLFTLLNGLGHTWPWFR